MKVIYIAGPFRGRNDWEVHQNINRAEALAFQVWKLGAVALCPHNNTRHFDGTLNDRVWLDGDLELLKRSDALLTTLDWQRSKGASAEVAFAQQEKIPVFHLLSDLEEWLNANPRSPLPL